VEQPSALGGIRPCQLCKQMRSVAPISFHRNVGMLVARRTYTLHGELCKSCLNRAYWEFTWRNFVQGWWGLFSLWLTPIYFVTNTYSFAAARYRLRDALE
jgi:hypothetical protein